MFSINFRSLSRITISLTEDSKNYSHFFTLYRFALYMSGLRLRYVTAGRYRYCYAERGTLRSDKTTILFIHGFSSSKDMWTNVVQVRYGFQYADQCCAG